MSEMIPILAVGSIAIDTIQTPNGNRENILGGSATYFSLAASMFVPVKLVGIVGNDYPDTGWKLLKSHNINTDNIQVVDGKTFRWGCRYNHDYSIRDTLFTELGVFNDFSPIIRDEDLRSDLVFLGNIHPDLQLMVARSTTSANYIVSDTMNLWIDMYPEMVGEVLSLSNIFLLNHEEAFQFTGINDIPESARCLHDYGPEIVVIKMGSDGAYLSLKNQSIYVPVFPVENVVDPTGAGDSFAGGFLGSLAQMDKPNFIEAVLTGSAVASYCVENFGPESLINLTRDNLGDRIETIRNLMLTS